MDIAVDTVVDENLVSAVSDAIWTAVGADPTISAYFQDPAKRREFAKLILDGTNKASFLQFFSPDEAPEAATTAEVLIAYNAVRALAAAPGISIPNTKKKIVPTRGRGGGLRIVDLAGAAAETALPAEIEEERVEQNEVAVAVAALHLENSYYPYVQNWANGEEGPCKKDSCLITGGRLPGFTWENPDLLSIEFESLPFVGSVDFTITSFEVKLHATAQGVWQASHYRSYSHYVYVAFAQDERAIRDKDDGRVFELAVEFGLGILSFCRVGNGGSFKEIQSPRLNRPDSDKINEVISNFANEELRSNIISALNAPVVRVLRAVRI